MKEQFGNITLYNADCMDILRELPDKQLAPCDEEWVRSYAADKLLGIQMIDKGCANAEYIIRLRKE